MEIKEATKRYKLAAGNQFVRPDKPRCYTRNNAVHLLGKQGQLLAVVHEDGSVVHGRALAAWMNQFALGMAGPAR